MTEVSYRCPECGGHYQDEELAEKYENLCKVNNACSLDITKYSIEATPQLDIWGVEVYRSKAWLPS